MQEFSSLIIEPALIAMLSWWFGTGIILLLVRVPQARFSTARFFWSLISIPALYLISQSMLDNSNANAYIGFVSTIVIWGWHELAFLTGWISGSRRVELQKDMTIWSRFKQSVEVIWHHELALFITLLFLVFLQAGHPNHTAICTFTLLWLMRLSSKLNLFFGVPQVGEEYLPQHLAYLGSYFRKSAVSSFFYVSISLSLITWIYIVWQSQSGQVSITPHWVLLATLLGLAIVEHVLMVIPFSLEKVWGWALESKWTTVIDENKNPLAEAIEEKLIIPIANSNLLKNHGINSK
jgi:putative photosynthetic complex assembly protein 2